MPPWRTPAVTANHTLKVSSHLTLQTRPSYHEMRMSMKIFGKLRSMSLPNNPEWTNLSKAFEASRKEQKTRLPLSMKYVTVSLRQCRAWEVDLFFLKPNWYNEWIKEDKLEYMLKGFWDDRRNCNSSIVVDITMVPSWIFNYGDHSAVPKLSWDKWVRQHVVEQVGQSMEKRKRSILKMLCSNAIIVRAFACLHTTNGLNHIGDRNFVIVTITGDTMRSTEIFVFACKPLIQLFDFGRIVGFRILLECLFERVSNGIWRRASIDNGRKATLFFPV